MTDPVEPSTSATTSPTKEPTSAPVIHPRREPFEHGLIPIPKLIFTDPIQTLAPLKQKLISLSRDHRLDSALISEALQISIDHARLVIDTLASILHSDSDPLVRAKPEQVDSVGADVHDLMLFLYIQSYKRLLPRSHKDSASVADVWPSTSAFDGYLSALSPLQLVRSNSRRFMPSQADEEAHQLSYLQKHLANIVSLLAEPVEGEGEESLVIRSRDILLAAVADLPDFHTAVPSSDFEALKGELEAEKKKLEAEKEKSRNLARQLEESEERQRASMDVEAHLTTRLSTTSCMLKQEQAERAKVMTMERFEHLGFLIQFGEKGHESIHLSQAAPFFANSDPDMPAVPVPAAQVHDWLLQNIATALEHLAERISAKENGPPGSSDQDVAMADACTSTPKASTSARGPCFIEGISKSSFVKQASDIKGSSVKVLNCHDSVIYILAPLRYATIYGCSDATIVLGAVGKAVRVEHCERVHVITVAKRICIANCRECVFFLGVNQRPLIVGDNHKLQVAPYNTFYPHLKEHMHEVGIEATINRWDEPLALGMVDPHDSLSHPAGVSDVQAETATHVDPDQFTNFLIPNWFGGESPGSTEDNPFTLPDAYVTSQERNQKNLAEIKQKLREAPLEENKKKELSCALHMYFKDWLYASGNIRQLYCLQGD